MSAYGTKRTKRPGDLGLLCADNGQPFLRTVCREIVPRRGCLRSFMDAQDETPYSGSVRQISLQPGCPHPFSWRSAAAVAEFRDHRSWTIEHCPGLGCCCASSI